MKVLLLNGDIAEFLNFFMQLHIYKFYKYTSVRIIEAKHQNALSVPYYLIIKFLINIIGSFPYR
jgi:hypothetical protein